MIEGTFEVKGASTTIKTLEKEGVDLLKWALNEPGVYATISARVDGRLYIEVGGVTVDTKTVMIGDTVTWDRNQRQFIISRSTSPSEVMALSKQLGRHNP